ncbi:Flp family type IVb pilin [Shewanella marina]|uniref:Flp family type IVb pilin n=1 Tax=Shewanella marina TaxID=487319 RepID=UPI000A01D9D0|nr:Flp family type IVb pilin [Shewanella marina]
MIKLYSQAMAFLATYKNDERGVTAIEYGLIAVAMAAMLSAVFVYTGTDTGVSLVDRLAGLFSNIATDLAGAKPNDD